MQPVDRETRKLFTIHWRLHLTSDVDFTLKDGGRGLIAFKDCVELAIRGLEVHINGS